ncbi:SGNH/GDSL hydrolase family protein [Edaphobacter modestus]|uniref:Lysophospholipase L1-like esterase n=1 Tax=Edaphobacter modestus TaxID=388466 RepID=A0A4Q7YXA3_9BACT|nr:SGNH/GDSL hydrolase family protein [Edaphobacter modestus]RZU42064.1 lysophospholipase L1-like esterase [Edaphobacter modestus]
MVRGMIALLAGTLVSASAYAQTPAAAPTATTATADTAKQIATMQTKLNDWPQLSRYRDANASLPSVAADERRVVFYGDSITDAWAKKPEEFFPGKPYVGRGISGQTTPQMVVRFQQDVVHLKPAVVVILAGTNDIAGNTGPSTPEMIEDNFESMVAIANANNIKVILSSILPADHYNWQPGAHPAEQIREMNTRLKELCRKYGLVYLDYYTAMANASGGMNPDLAKDGVHPTSKAYAMMSPLAEKAIAEALAH